MLKHWWFGVLVLLLGISSISAQDGGSTLAAWADTPASALNLSVQIESPHSTMFFHNINTYTATNEPAPTCAASHSYSIWVTFIAPQTGLLNLDAKPSSANIDILMAAYQTSVASANQIRCANLIGPSSMNYENLNFKMVAGRRYYVMIAAVGSGAGVDGSTVFEFSPTTNGVIYQPFQIPASGTYSNIQANIENANSSEAALGICSFMTHYVFYSFKPSTSGRYEFSTNGSNYDTVLFLVEDNTALDCNEDISTVNLNSRLRPTLTAGHTYVIAIGQTINAIDPLTDDMVLSLRVRKL